MKHFFAVINLAALATCATIDRTAISSDTDQSSRSQPMELGAFSISLAVKDIEPRVHSTKNSVFPDRQC